MKRIIILFHLILYIFSISVFIVNPVIYAQQQEIRSCQNSEENIRKDAILSKIADLVAGGVVKGENVSFVCVTDHTIILRFDYVLKTRNNEANWGWSAIDMLGSQANYTLDQIVDYDFVVNQTEMKHLVAILSK